MKKLLLLTIFLGTFVAQAQMANPYYNKFAVSAAVGADLLRKPFDPQPTADVAASYKFAENYAKTFVDTAYVNFGYTRDAFTSYHVGLQRTMMNDHDRAGLLAVIEGGAHRLSGGAVKPSAAIGAGVAFDLSGDPYPAVFSGVTVSLVPKLNKVASLPLFLTLTIGVSKSF